MTAYNKLEICMKSGCVTRLAFMGNDIMVSVCANKGAYCCLTVESQTLKSHVQLCDSHTTTMCAQPASPGILLATSTTAKFKATDENQV